MNKVLIHKNKKGKLMYAVVTPFGVKPFGTNKSGAISCAKLLSVWHQDYSGDETEEDYKDLTKVFGETYVGCFFVETANEQN